MKTTTVSICFVALTVALISNPFRSSAQSDCEHLTRFYGDYMLETPAGFTGTSEFKVYPEKVATVTTKNCEGPFTVVITNPDGTVESTKTYFRGPAVSDTSYIEMPEPPYDLLMRVESVYMAREKN